ncbi:MAG: hypothetical protein KJ606_12770 [Chloroflexi bacterium]|nr:hypothetical protein [Chloroflexota bacterium]
MDHLCPIHPTESRHSECLATVYTMGRMWEDDDYQTKLEVDGDDIYKMAMNERDRDIDRIRAYGGDEFEKLSKKRLEWFSFQSSNIHFEIQPPAAPIYPSWAENGEGVMIGIGLLMGIIGSILWAVFGSTITNWIAIIGWLIAVVMTIVAQSDFYKRYKQYESAWKTHERRLKYWCRLRYCFNCEKVFDPYTGETFTPSETHNHIHKTIRDV